MHTLVYVIIDPGTSDVDAEVRRVLLGSEASPEKVFSSYEVRCCCRGSLARSDAFTTFDQGSVGSVLKLELDELRRTKKHEEYKDREAEILCHRMREVQKIERADSRYAMIDPGCDICNGTGIYECTHDPREHWDWYVIGGRWTGLFEGLAPESLVLNEDLNGNIAYGRDVLGRAAPGALLTREGCWFDGELDFSHTFEMEQERYKEEGIRQWEETAQKLLNAHWDDFVVVVDCHS